MKKRNSLWRIGGVMSCLLIVSILGANAQTGKTRNVILLTMDGLRVQEMFGGVDSEILKHAAEAKVENIDSLKGAYWADTPEKRREKLFPFFWRTLIRQGVILGNPAVQSSVQVKNPHHFSYPGYAEILTGRPQPSIDSNDAVQNPVPTILDFVRAKLFLNEYEVAAFGSWVRFNEICSFKRDSFLVNAGYEDYPKHISTATTRKLTTLQHQMLTPWDSVRFDAVTFGYALEHLLTQKPRFLYIALGETDDWAHMGRYDRYIAMANYLDQCLMVLWDTVQSLEEYRDKTTLVLATDHGRGNTIQDWGDHGANIPGAENIWIAAIGPDTPDQGELSNTPVYYEANIAATVLRYLNLDYTQYSSECYPPIPEMFQ